MTGALPESSTAIGTDIPVDAPSYTNSIANTLPQQVPAQGGQTYPPTDELMWHLFNSQLSMECFESDFISLDANMNF